MTDAPATTTRGGIGRTAADACRLQTAHCISQPCAMSAAGSSPSAWPAAPASSASSQQPATLRDERPMATTGAGAAPRGRLVALCQHLTLPVGSVDGGTVAAESSSGGGWRYPRIVAPSAGSIAAPCAPSLASPTPRRSGGGHRTRRLLPGAVCGMRPREGQRARSPSHTPCPDLQPAGRRTRRAASTSTSFARARPP